MFDCTYNTQNSLSTDRVLSPVVYSGISCVKSGGCVKRERERQCFQSKMLPIILVMWPDADCWD